MDHDNWKINKYVGHKSSLIGKHNFFKGSSATWSAFIVVWTFLITVYTWEHADIRHKCKKTKQKTKPKNKNITHPPQNTAATQG